MKKMKVGTKITSLFILIVIVTVSILGITSATAEKKLIQEQLDYTTKQFSSSLASKMNDFLEAKVNVVEGISGLHAIKSMDAANGQDTLSVFQKQYPEFALVFLLDLNGDQIVRSDMAASTNLSSRQYFKDVISKDKTVISDVLISSTTKKPAVVIAVPVHDANNKLVGVVGATLDLSKVNDLRSEIKIGKTGYAFITDSKGTALAHPTQSLVDKQSDLTGIAIVKKALSGGSGTLTYTYQGQKVYGSYAKVSLTGWTAIVRQSYTEAYQPVNDILIQTLTIDVIILIIAIICGLLFSKWIVAPLLVLTKGAKELSEGRLNYKIHVKTKDEIGQLAGTFEIMRENLRDLLKRISDSADNVKTSSHTVLDYSQQTENVSMQIEAAITELAKGTDEQARGLQNTAMSMNTIAKSIDDIAKNSSQSFKTSSEASTLVKNGTKIVDEQNTKMEETTHAVNQVSEIVFSLNDMAAEIGQIIEVIQGVTKQTNLLALNAAIEAARAGEQGKGFAVVAEEVRKLAEQSHASTEEIQDIILKIQQTTKSAVERVNFAGETIVEQSKAVENTSTIFKEILDMVTVIAGELQEISVATTHVKDESETVLSNIENISAVSQEAAAGAEEVTASTEEQTMSIQAVVKEIEQLSKLAEQLQNSTKEFQYE